MKFDQAVWEELADRHTDRQSLAYYSIDTYLDFVTFEEVISVNNYLELKLYLKTLIYNLHPLLVSVF